MIRSALRALLAATLFAAVQAHAATTVTFSGVVTQSFADGLAGPAVGETVSGWYTFAVPDGLAEVGTDGHSYADSDAWNLTGTDVGITVRGAATFSGGIVVALSSADGYQRVTQSDYRSYVGDYNYAGAGAWTYRLGDYTWNFLEAHAYDFDGAASPLFGDPAAGVALGQPVSSGVAYGMFQGSTAQGRFYGSLDLAQFSLSSVPEPSGLALLLAGAALAALRARRRPTVRA